MVGVGGRGRVLVPGHAVEETYVGCAIENRRVSTASNRDKHKT